MRVIAGSARGTRLAAPAGMGTRPTADRVREALFSIITSRLVLTELSVLDICAGTGSLGIEALSRGAATCCFVESGKGAAASLKRNLAATRFEERSRLLQLDALKALNLLARDGSRFDLIFFDPPYAAGLYQPVLEGLDSLGLVAPEGLVVAESASRTVLPDRVGSLVKNDRRVYGDTALEMYTVEAA